MKNIIRNKLFAGAASVLALIGSVHAPLYAEDRESAIDEVRAEVILVESPLDQAKLLADAASAAIDKANASLTAEIILDLNTDFGRSAGTAIARNEVGQ